MVTRLSNSTITVERDIPSRGYNCTFFISDLDIIKAPINAGHLIDEAFEEFRQKLCNILNISEEKN